MCIKKNLNIQINVNIYFKKMFTFFFHENKKKYVAFKEFHISLVFEKKKYIHFMI